MGQKPKKPKLLSLWHPEEPQISQYSNENIIDPWQEMIYYERLSWSLFSCMLISQLSRSIANVMTHCGVDIFLLFPSKLPRPPKNTALLTEQGNDGVRRQFPFAHTRKLRGTHCGSYRVNRRLLED